MTGINSVHTGANSLETWFSAIKRVQEEDKVVDLIDAALRDFESDPHLQEIKRELEELSDSIPSLSNALTELSVHRRRLRRREHYNDDQVKDLEAVFIIMDELENPFDRNAPARSPSHWYSPSGVSDRIRACFGALQLYAELLASANAPTSGHAPGNGGARRPLPEVSADRFTLLQAKEQLGWVGPDHEIGRSCGVGDLGRSVADGPDR